MRKDRINWKRSHPLVGRGNGTLRTGLDEGLETTEGGKGRGGGGKTDREAISREAGKRKKEGKLKGRATAIYGLWSRIPSRVAVYLGKKGGGRKG